MNRKHGALLALLAALLFGVGTPLVKLRFGGVDPVLLASLINIGSGLGVALLTRIPWHPRKLFTAENRLPFAGSILTGGILAPVLLVWGIAHTPGSAAALLMNLEAAFTVLIAWLVFREQIGPRMVVGLVLLTLGGVLVSGSEGAGPGRFLAGLAIAASCLCWAIDNNCTARLRNVPAAEFTLWKGLIAGTLLLALCIGRGTPLASLPTLVEAFLLGTCCHGLALLVFVMAIQRLGAGRTAAYFGAAPFIGAAAAVVMLGDPVTPHLLIAAVFMALGVAALLTEPLPIAPI